MKNICFTILLGLGLIVSFVACQEDEIDFYTGPIAINMTLNDGDGTFVKGESDQEKVFKIKLRVQGDISNDRVLKFAFGEQHTAVAGTNFELPMSVGIEAGRQDTVIECKVYRTGLTEKPLFFDLIVDSSSDFVGGVNGELIVKLMIGFPTQWIDPTGWAAGYYLGKCTQAKYQFVFEQLGTLDLSDYQGAWGSGYRDLANKLNSILREQNPPLLDDDGSVMKFGPGY